MALLFVPDDFFGGRLFNQGWQDGFREMLGNGFESFCFPVGKKISKDLLFCLAVGEKAEFVFQKRWEKGNRAENECCGWNGKFEKGKKTVLCGDCAVEVEEGEGFWFLISHGNSGIFI